MDFNEILWSFLIIGIFAFFGGYMLWVAFIYEGDCRIPLLDLLLKVWER